MVGEETVEKEEERRGDLSEEKVDGLDDSQEASKEKGQSMGPKIIKINNLN